MEKFTFDAISQTLTLSAKFAAMMNDPDSAEYQLVVRFRKDYPNLTIVKKTHKTPSKYQTKNGEKFNCNQFKNLTYDNMEAFIKALPDHDEYLKQFSFARHSAAAIQTNRYKVVREWFVAQFPEYRKNPLFYLYNHPQLIYFADIQKQEEETMENAG